MWRVELPNHSARETSTTCINRVRDAELRRRLQRVEPDIVAASDAFEDAAPLTELHTIPTADNVAGIVSTAEMTKVYVQRMAKTGAPGREIYDQLRAAARNDRCPLCGQRLVTTLDHHLPKAEYPALAVAPVNLVPSCSDCKGRSSTPCRNRPLKKRCIRILITSKTIGGFTGVLFKVLRRLLSSVCKRQSDGATC